MGLDPPYPASPPEGNPPYPPSQLGENIPYPPTGGNLPYPQEQPPAYGWSSTNDGPPPPSYSASANY